MTTGFCISSKLIRYRKSAGITISDGCFRLWWWSSEGEGFDVEHVQVDPKNYFIGKVLVKLILGFLACSSLKMEVAKRVEAVQGLLDLTVHETREPATVSYILSLSSGAVFTKKANRMIRWERENSKFFHSEDGLVQWKCKYDQICYIFLRSNLCGCIT